MCTRTKKNGVIVHNIKNVHFVTVVNGVVDGIFDFVFSENDRIERSV